MHKFLLHLADEGCVQSRCFLFLYKSGQPAHRHPYLIISAKQQTNKILEFHSIQQKTSWVGYTTQKIQEKHSGEIQVTDWK